ncbi:hypothetical protein VTN02DRAFT_2646 [Thermoascus thermophilus]
MKHVDVRISEAVSKHRGSPYLGLLTHRTRASHITCGPGEQPSDEGKISAQRVMAAARWPEEDQAQAVAQRSPRGSRLPHAGPANPG